MWYAARKITAFIPKWYLSAHDLGWALYLLVAFHFRSHFLKGRLIADHHLYVWLSKVQAVSE